MTATAQPTNDHLPHHDNPCPPWCDGCQRYLSNGWSDYEGNAWRPHARKLDEWKATAQYAQGPCSITVDLEIAGYERYDVDWTTRTVAHNESEPLIGFHFSVTLTREDGTTHYENAHCDLTAEQMRHLAQMATDSAYWLDHLEELPSRRS
jgi:hypothetical protein